MPRLQEVRENPVTLLPEVSHYDVPECLATLIDKKVAFENAQSHNRNRDVDDRVEEIALNCIEAFVHWLLTWLYTPYTNLYELKTVLAEYPANPRPVEEVRTHRFRDGTPLFNLTEDMDIGIQHRQEGPDRIIRRINGVIYPILFFLEGEEDARELHFSHETAHHLALVRDHEARPWIFRHGMLRGYAGQSWILDPGPTRVRENELVVYGRDNVRQVNPNAHVQATISLDPADLQKFGPIFAKWEIASFSKVRSDQGLRIFNATGRPMEHVKVSDKRGEKHVLKLAAADGTTYPVMGVNGKKHLELPAHSTDNDFILITQLPQSNPDKVDYLIRQSDGATLAASFKDSLLSGSRHWSTIETLGE